MQRTRFDPASDLAALAERPGLPQISSAFGPAWLAVRYEDVRAVLSNSVAFSNGALGRLEREQSGNTDGLVDPEESGFLLGYDPPLHTRVRRMLTGEFTAHRMRQLEAQVAEIVSGTLDAMEAAGSPADVVTEFALPVPSQVVGELLGVPNEDLRLFQHFTTVKLDYAVPLDERIALGKQQREFASELVNRHRAEAGDSLLGRLVRDHADELSQEQLIGIANLLIEAGLETTANMFSIGTLLLLENPDQLALVRDDPESADAAVEELLRYLSVAHGTVPRDVVVDTVIGGQQLRVGDLVLCSLPLANRDPALVEDGHRFDITRPSGNHVAFGHGIHHCIGASLARMEMRIGFPALLRRFPDMQLAVPHEEIKFREGTLVHGIDSLPVRWSGISGETS